MSDAHWYGRHVLRSSQREMGACPSDNQAGIRLARHSPGFVIISTLRRFRISRNPSRWRCAMSRPAYSLRISVPYFAISECVPYFSVPRCSAESLPLGLVDLSNELPATQRSNHG
jgi:hypothetical protein